MIRKITGGRLRYIIGNTFILCPSPPYAITNTKWYALRNSRHVEMSGITISWRVA